MEQIEKRLGMLKTSPFEHQLTSFRKAKLTNVFANFSEQGTGKTWSTIAEMFVLAKTGKIDRALVLAPKGVDANWMLKELPAHAPDPEDFPWSAELWRPKRTKARREELREFFSREHFLIFCMNWEAIRYKQPFELAEWFLKEGEGMIVADESQRIKNPNAKTTKMALKLRRWCRWRRILSGTPSPNGPFDLWSQMKFLDDRILDCHSYVAFKARHAQMAGMENALFRNLYYKQLNKVKKQFTYKTPEQQEELAKKRCPQLVEKDSHGMPIYKNIDRLNAVIKPHSVRYTKDECLDLPPKIYTQTFFELTKEQMRVYSELRDKCRLIFDDDTILPLLKLTAMQKMLQVCSGYFISPDEGVIKIEGDNPKLDLFAESLEDQRGSKRIVWANLRAELHDLESLCVKMGIPSVSYHGGVSDSGREEAMSRFQDGDAEVFIGQPQSAGRGLTLHAAARVDYYSNSFDMELRSQSEDRAHRIGQKRKVIYMDYISEGTIEIDVIRALQNKLDLSAELLGDKFRRKIFS